jgi:hypothetical protein
MRGLVYNARVSGVRVRPSLEMLAPESLTCRREERTRHGVLTRMARPFGALATGFSDESPLEQATQYSHEPAIHGSPTCGKLAEKRAPF